MGKYEINREKISWRESDHETVIIHLDTTVYYALNSTGTMIWKLLGERPRTSEEIIQSLAEHFSMDAHKMSPDIQEHLSGMLDEGLILYSEE
jgi:hypothetical protein